VRVKPIYWAAVQQLGGYGANLTVFFVLALLLPPQDFGLVALATTWTAFMLIFSEIVFSEIGFSAALIQRQTLDEGHRSTTFCVNLGLGVLLFLFGVAASWPIAWFYQMPELRPVISVLSLGFVINSLALTQIALAHKEFRFRDLAIRDITATLIGGSIAVALAYKGYGVWSLVAQSLVSTTIGSLLIWTSSPWRPHFREVSWRYITELWGYSSQILLFNLFKFFSQNTDKLLIGYLLGPIALGAYTFAYKLVVIPFTSLRSAVSSYLFPKFSSMFSDVKTIKQTYVVALKLVNAIFAPLLMLVVLLAPKIIPSLFDPEWIIAVPLIQFFSVIVLAQSLMSPVGELMKALGKPAWLFQWSVFFTGIMTVSLWVGSWWSLQGIAVGLTLTYLLALPLNFYIVQRLIHFTLVEACRAIFPAVFAAFVATGCGQMVLNIDRQPGYMQMGMSTIVALGLYLALMVVLDRRFILEALGRGPGRQDVAVVR
jgi:O-antigen/teichoic acid export membrane protein